MGDPRVTERDNPLVRHLNSIARANEEFGSRRAGGGAPIQEEPAPSQSVPGGSGTVLPPPPRPLTAEEAMGDTASAAELEELERLWAADPKNPANQQANPGPVPMPRPQQPAPRAAGIALPENVGGASIGLITGLDLTNGAVYTNTGRLFPITDEELTELRTFAYKATLRAIVEQTNLQLAALRNSLGIQVEEKSGPLVPPVRNDSEPKKGRTKRVPVVPEPAGDAKPEGRSRRKKGGSVAVERGGQ